MIPEHELERYNVLTEQIIGCAIEVHRNLGPGLLERAVSELLRRCTFPCQVVENRRVCAR